MALGLHPLGASITSQYLGEVSPSLGFPSPRGLHHLEVCITSSSPLLWAVCDLTFSISLGSLIYWLVPRFGVSITLEVSDASGSPSLW